MRKELSDIIQVTGPSISTFLQHPSLPQAYMLSQELAEETRHEGEPNKNIVNIFVSSW